MPPHAEVWVGLIEHTQQNSEWTPVAAAAGPYFAIANQTLQALRAVASAAAAVMVVQPGCSAPAVVVSDQRLVHTAAAVELIGERVVRRRRKVRRRGDWRGLAAE